MKLIIIATMNNQTQTKTDEVYLDTDFEDDNGEGSVQLELPGDRDKYVMYHAWDNGDGDYGTLELKDVIERYPHLLASDFSLGARSNDATPKIDDWREDIKERIEAELAQLTLQRAEWEDKQELND